MAGLEELDTSTGSIGECRGLERGLGDAHDLGKCGRVLHREIGKHLAINFDAGLAQAINKLAVGQAVLARCGVDALNPETSHIALAVSAVIIGMLSSLHDRFVGTLEVLTTWPLIALGALENGLMAPACSDASLHTNHAMFSLSTVRSVAGSLLQPVRQEPLDALLIGLRGYEHPIEHAPGSWRFLTAVVRLHTLGPHNLAGTSDLEATRSALVCLHLRHWYFVSLHRRT